MKSLSVEENPSNINPNSGSLSEVNLHKATGNERLMGVLYRKIEDLAQEVHELKTQKILDETKMPPELLEQAGMLPPDPTKLDRGRGFRPLLRSEIEEAIKASHLEGQIGCVSLHQQGFRNLIGCHRPALIEHTRR